MSASCKKVNGMQKRIEALENELAEARPAK
jgi:hypothetical protein